MTDYAKGSKPRDLDAAEGGPTLGRVRSFLKDEECGMLGPPNDQEYSKTGSEGKDAACKPNKQLSMGSLKKSKASAL
jgi:hypothetical protein